jgi:hypothetical protein
VILAVVVAVGGGAFWSLEKHAGETAPEPVLTPEAKAYTRNLKLSDVEMKATENALRQMLVEIEGSITNAGDRPVRRVELTCVFYDPYGEVILRERVPIVRGRDGVLGPGETRQFRLPFDAIPDDWNQTMPQLVIAQVIFG